jgi:hypothetical protein
MSNKQICDKIAAEFWVPTVFNSDESTYTYTVTAGISKFTIVYDVSNAHNATARIYKMHQLITSVELNVYVTGDLSFILDAYTKNDTLAFGLACEGMRAREETRKICLKNKKKYRAKSLSSDVHRLIAMIY